MPTGFSDHYMTYCIRKCVRVPLNSQNVIRIRSMKHYSVEAFRNRLSNCDWSSVLNSTCVNFAWDQFKSLFTNVLDQIVSEKDEQIKARTEPWITPTILELMRKRGKIRRLTSFQRLQFRFHLSKLYISA